MKRSVVGLLGGLKQLNDNEAFAWPRDMSENKRISSSKPASQTRSLKMGCPPGATAQWQQVYSRTCMTPPTRAWEHPALSRIALKRRKVVCARSSSLLTTDIINQKGFCVETTSVSLQLPFTCCSQMWLSSALQAKLQTWVTTESSHTKSSSLTRENLKDKGPRGTYPASSRIHLLQDFRFPVWKNGQKELGCTM